MHNCAVLRQSIVSYQPAVRKWHSAHERETFGLDLARAVDQLDLRKLQRTKTPAARDLMQHAVAVLVGAIRALSFDRTDPAGFRLLFPPPAACRACLRSAAAPTPYIASLHERHMAAANASKSGRLVRARPLRFLIPIDPNSAQREDSR